MAYSDQVLLSRDPDFTDRIGAAGAVELQPRPGILPEQWSRESVWWIAAAPGFADKYASALAGGVDRPGNDPSVISDEDVLAAVQAFIVETTAPPAPAA